MYKGKIIHFATVKTLIEKTWIYFVDSTKDFYSDELYNLSDALESHYSVLIITNLFKYLLKTVSSRQNELATSVIYIHVHIHIQIYICMSLERIGIYAD